MVRLVSKWRTGAERCSPRTLFGTSHTFCIQSGGFQGPVGARRPGGNLRGQTSPGQTSPGQTSPGQTSPGQTSPGFVGGPPSGPFLFAFLYITGHGAGATARQDPGVALVRPSPPGASPPATEPGRSRLAATPSLGRARSSPGSPGWWPARCCGPRLLRPGPGPAPGARRWRPFRPAAGAP